MIAIFLQRELEQLRCSHARRSKWWAVFFCGLRRVFVGWTLIAMVYSYTFSFTATTLVPSLADPISDTKYKMNTRYLIELSRREDCQI